MKHPILVVLYLVCLLRFTIPTLQCIPAMLRLAVAILFGKVIWPGPVIHSFNLESDIGKNYLGLKPSHLFPEFYFYAFAMISAMFFVVSMLLEEYSLLDAYIRVTNVWVSVVVSLVVATSGFIGLPHLQFRQWQVNIVLSNLSTRDEPRSIESRSTETEYAIQHPLIDESAGVSDEHKALNMFDTATALFNAGDRQKGLLCYEKALELDPRLHEHAIAALEQRAGNYCKPPETGQIAYWIGVHAEYLCQAQRAKAAYETAASAFHDCGYACREARAHCNLGNVKMQTHDPTGMDEFAAAVKLNPRNGSAYINIGAIYYSCAERGDPRFEMAMDAFAEAVLADPVTYGPKVIARMRELGYTWKVDVDDITARVDARRGGAPARDNWIF